MFNMSRKAMVWMGAVGITLACTCGPLSQVQQAVEDAQDLATQVEEVAPTLQAAATEFEDMQPTLDALSTQSAEAEAAGGGGTGDTALCDLLTDADFQSALSQGISSTSHGASSETDVLCVYSLADYSAFTVAIIIGDDQASTDQNWETGFKVMLAGGETLTGPWDDGFWSTTANGVYFKKALYIVAVLHSSGESTKTGTISLATLFAERLP